jgi:hypothetical protein
MSLLKKKSDEEEIETKLLSKEDILGADDIVVEKVEVSEWGGHIFVKGMTGTQRDAFEASINQQRGKSRSMNMQNIRARLAAQTICDDAGVRVFNNKEVKALGEKSAAALDRVFSVAMRLSGITDEDVEELTEEMEENPSENSASD